MAEQWRAAAVAMAALALSVALLLVTMKDNEANSGSRSVLYVLGGDAMKPSASAELESYANILTFPSSNSHAVSPSSSLQAESTSGDVSEQSKWAIRYLQTGKLFHGEKSGHPASGVDCYYKHPASYCAQKEQSLKGSGSSSNSRPSVFVVSLPHLFDVRQVGSTYDADCFFYHSVDHCMRLRAEQSKARQQSLGHGGAKQTKSKEAEVASKPQIYTPASPPHLSHSTADVHMKEARIKMEEEKAEDKVKQAKEELHKLATAKRSSHLKELHKSERITLKKWKHDAEQSNDPVVKWYLEHGIKPIDALRGSRASTMSLSMKPKGREHQQSPSAQKHLADFQVSKQNLMEGSGTSSSSSERANKKELSIKALETEAQMDGLALIPIKLVKDEIHKIVHEGLKSDAKWESTEGLRPVSSNVRSQRHVIAQDDETTKRALSSKEEESLDWEQKHGVKLSAAHHTATKPVLSSKHEDPTVVRAEDEAKSIGVKGIEALGFSNSAAFVKHLEREGV